MQRLFDTDTAMRSRIEVFLSRRRPWHQYLLSRDAFAINSFLRSALHVAIETEKPFHERSIRSLKRSWTFSSPHLANLAADLLNWILKGADFKEHVFVFDCQIKMIHFVNASTFKTFPDLPHF